MTKLRNKKNSQIYDYSAENVRRLFYEFFNDPEAKSKYLLLRNQELVAINNDLIERHKEEMEEVLENNELFEEENAKLRDQIKTLLHRKPKFRKKRHGK